MKFGTVPLLRGLLLLAAAVSLPSYGADWSVSPQAYVVRAMPTGGQIQAQNPPAFTWPMYPGTTNTASYILELTQSGATPVVQTFTVNRLWYLPTTALAAGSYSWRVRPSTVVDWSASRTFVINASSQPFIVPDNTTLKNYIVSRPRPRALPDGFLPRSAWTPAMVNDRGSGMLDLIGGVQKRMTSVPTYTDANWPIDTSIQPLTSAGAAQLNSIRWAMLDVTRQIEASSLLWVLTKDPQFLNEAVRRGNELAALNPTYDPTHVKLSPTAYVEDDLDDRMIDLALMKAIDLLGPALNPTTKAVWLKSVELRTTDMYNAFNTPDGGLDQFPFDSHGAVAQGYIALIATLAIGEIPAASTWFDFTFRAYVNSTSPWSGAEGGFANGTSYGQHSALAALSLWQPIAAATGINMFKKPWALGFMKSFMHFQPPGSLRHTFGDEHEAAPVYTELKGYASRFATPEAAWYVRSLPGSEDPLTVLQAPYPLPVASVTTATAPPNSALYTSIGWAALHSDINNPLRTSLYFKSSQYGSYNHSHADQNSLVLNSGGRLLLIESGYYDWYGSPLWHDWYRQTKAHNAITFDGGQGQPVDTYNVQLTRNGKVTSFGTSSAMDYVEGDATAAYNGVLTLARRSIWYLRAQDAMVVLDKLAAPVAHSFEWNMHTPVLMTAANNVVTVKNVDRSVCIRPVTPGLSFVKRTAPAPKAGVVEDHAAYVLPAATSGEFLIVLDVGCKNPTITLSNTLSGRTLTVGGVPVTLPK